ncbi:MAG TPA: hypothetical protein VFI80_10090 [Burkholderiales bacterium]|nr:hypothetical protein [Burkholderiales bacterium]
MRTFVRIIGVLSFASAFAVLWEPRRWYWLFGPIFDLAGTVGVAMALAVIGMFLLLVSTAR